VSTRRLATCYEASSGRLIIEGDIELNCDELDFTAKVRKHNDEGTLGLLKKLGQKHDPALIVIHKYEHDTTHKRLILPSKTFAFTQWWELTFTPEEREQLSSIGRLSYERCWCAALCTKRTGS